MSSQGDSFSLSLVSLWAAPVKHKAIPADAMIRIGRATESILCPFKEMLYFEYINVTRERDGEWI
ncbi:hypothetical protein GCM10007052_00200 [Halioglobus japonicus]|nr:hypothetical protein GCM10007052_00200 [Halioglobus japonicus]